MFKKSIVAAALASTLIGTTAFADSVVVYSNATTVGIPTAQYVVSPAQYVVAAPQYVVAAPVTQYVVASPAVQYVVAPSVVAQPRTYCDQQPVVRTYYSY